jgi:hypothetical protein
MLPIKNYWKKKTRNQKDSTKLKKYYKENLGL